MSTLAFSLHRRVLDRKEVSTSKDTGPSQFEERPDGLGHEGALAFKRHAIAVYNGYMGATVLIGSSYMFLVWIYFQCTNCKGTMTLLTRKHVVVIGGSSGIGLCVAEPCLATVRRWP